VVRQAAPCAFAPAVRHLDRLPAAQPWTRPAALVVFDGLSVQPAGTRAVLMRPTRETLALRTVAEALADGTARRLDRGLMPVAANASAPTAYIALIVAPPAEHGATATCIAQAGSP
jgi:hypothetical protein